ncbi:MAG: agmatine deiminase family protein, partial [Bacteroidia bacterium]
MRKLLSLITVFLFFVSYGSSQDLPKYLTEEEKQLMPFYLDQARQGAPVNPPATQVRAMAEWEELDGILVTWTSYTSIIREIVKYARLETQVYIVCSDSNTVKNNLTNNNIPLSNIHFLIAPYNSVWSRDYGQWNVYTDDVDSLLIVDWIYNRPRPLDDAIPGILANHLNLPFYEMTTPPYDLIHTGGNYMVDGFGTAFSSNLIVDENPTKTIAEIDTILNLFMGIDRYRKMTVLPYDGIHHIDMHMKLLDEETILLGQFPPGVSDGPQIEANLLYILNNFNSIHGTPYKIIRIPMPPST